MVSMMRWVRAAVLLGAFCIAVLKAGLIPYNAATAAERDAAIAAETEQSKTVGGLTVYLGVLPAEVIKGPPAHVLLSKGPHDYDILSKSPHEYEIVAGIFDASGTRVSDAVVTAQVSGLGLSGNAEQLAPMQIAGTAAYGGFVDLPESDLYNVNLTVQRPGASAILLEFKYDHRR
jgi:hypothetical protein